MVGDLTVEAPSDFIFIFTIFKSRHLFHLSCLVGFPGNAGKVKSLINWLELDWSFARKRLKYRVAVLVTQQILR